MFEWHILWLPWMCGIKSVIHVCVYLMYTIYVWHVLYAVQCTCMLNSVYTWLNMFKWHIWCIPLYVACTLCCTCICGMKSMQGSQLQARPFPQVGNKISPKFPQIHLTQFPLNFPKFTRNSPKFPQIHTKFPKHTWFSSFYPILLSLQTESRQRIPFLKWQSIFLV